MPYTVNGIGTTYYGKKNLDRNLGTCEHCGYKGELLSYETRLWFVVVYIPIIPLGKKQLLDYCPKCRRHRVLALSEWQRIGTEALTKGMDELSAKPDDPDSAIKFHSTLDLFNKQNEAEQLAQRLEQRFATHAEVQYYLGVWYERKGRGAQADACFERALQVDPANPNIRRAVAIGCLQKGDLDRARQLLDFMAQSGSRQDAAVLALLASAYQQKGRHQEALEILTIISSDFPNLAQKDKKFRRAVQTSEKALFKKESLLPKARFNWRLAITALAILVIGLGVVLFNQYMTTHQTLYLVNGFGAQATVTISGAGTFTVPHSGFTKATLPEGQYRVTVKSDQGELEPVAVAITNTLSERVSRDKVFMLNVGSSAVLLWEQATYRVQPIPKESNPYRLHFGFQFLTLNHIDYPFQEFPERLKIKGDQAVTKTRVTILDVKPALMLNILEQEKVEPDLMLQYAEVHLSANPSDETLLQRYVNLTASHELLERGIAFLQKGLNSRPELVEWHRLYQTLLDNMGRTDELFSTYDALLQANPNNSLFLYLRGRIEAYGSKSLPYFDRSIQADASNPYPWFAKGYFEASRGDFAHAREACAKAVSLKPDADNMQDLLFYIRFALGEYDNLKQEAETALQQNALDDTALGRLQQILAMQGNIQAAQDAQDRFLTELKANMPQDSYEIENWVSIRLAYLRQDFSAGINLAKAFRNPEVANVALFSAYLSQFQMQAAEEAITKTHEVSSGGIICLLLRLGWLIAGDSDKAEYWLNQAKEQFSKGSLEERLIAHLLDRAQQDVLKQADDISFYPTQKAVLYTALAELYPAERQALLARAKQLNILRESPYYFLEKVIATFQSNISPFRSEP